MLFSQRFSPPVLCATRSPVVSEQPQSALIGSARGGQIGQYRFHTLFLQLQINRLYTRQTHAVSFVCRPRTDCKVPAFILSFFFLNHFYLTFIVSLCAHVFNRHSSDVPVFIIIICPVNPLRISAIEKIPKLFLTTASERN